MTDIYIKPEDEYIKLGQFLKKIGAVSSGVEAKYVIEDGIKVNEEIEYRRGRKLRDGDLIEYENEIYRIRK